MGKTVCNKEGINYACKDLLREYRKVGKAIKEVIGENLLEVSILKQSDSEFLVKACDETRECRRLQEYEVISLVKTMFAFLESHNIKVSSVYFMVDSEVSENAFVMDNRLMVFNLNIR